MIERLIFFGITGSYLGYRQSLKNQENVQAEAVVLRKQHAETLARINVMAEAQQRTMNAEKLLERKKMGVLKVTKSEP